MRVGGVNQAERSQKSYRLLCSLNPTSSAFQTQIPSDSSFEAVSAIWQAQRPSSCEDRIDPELDRFFALHDMGVEHSASGGGLNWKNYQESRRRSW
jgi:hypothetical protein